MTLEIADHPERHRYELTQDGKLAARIEYRMRGPAVIDLVHTEVDKEFEGQGLGSKIANFAFDDARTRGLRVVATCTYLQGWLRKHPEYAALAAPDDATPQ
jgi:predicted GNAT family acetyltransferase